MGTTNPPGPATDALDASGARSDDPPHDDRCRFGEMAASAPSPRLHARDKTLFWRLPSPLQLALLYRLHASAQRQPPGPRACGRRSHG